MNKFKENTIGNKKLGDPSLARLVANAQQLPEKLMAQGKSESGGYAVDHFMEKCLEIAERISEEEPPEKRGKRLAAEFETTRCRATTAVWEVYLWFQQHQEEFERMGTMSETMGEYQQRKYRNITLVPHENEFHEECENE